MRLNQKLYIKAIITLFIIVLGICIWQRNITLSFVCLGLLLSFGLYYLSTLTHQLIKLKKELRQNLYVDFNTSLPNRLKLLRDKKKLDHSTMATLIIINIDSFQNTNNFYGHAFGDAFLKVIAQWLSQNLPPIESTLYKFEADIYAILITVPFSEFNLKKYLKKLSSKITTDHILCQDVEVDTTLSIGATQGNTNLLKYAFIACKEAKNKRLAFMIYDQTSHTENEYLHNMQMHHILKDALAKDLVTPFFQPILNLKTNQIEKYETLMRICKIDGSYSMPSEFLHVAKHSKIYSKLSMSLIQKAFETFQISSNSFSINLSFLDMTNAITTSFILEKLEEFNVGPWVIFEILESDGIENYDAVIKFIEQVKAYGAKIAIDDFGAGYSNFERLTELRVDFIKIDGSLIKNLDKNEEMKVIVKTINTFAKELGIRTIAEYVHSKAILTCVRELDIDYAQGFYIGKPSPTLVNTTAFSNV